ncbi:Glycosyltransferase involved in cell wall bisynthesis [Paramicrobacterium humi]|uniref:Glycosyltransferase involved in cell wall bisynthesis n=2 Tax=Paramicrobacterium humi TaxID=640635 RepID=A0A1H4ITG9_9MICO|nr:Glycosyltransferase involved in cell wall bisynthesis [Microbacterium humi]
MTTLRVIVDQMIPPVQGDLGAYSRDLARALIRTAPRGCDVEAIIAAHGDDEVADVRKRLGGLSGLHKTTLRRRELSAAWQLGVASPQVSTGLIHSPTLLAPLVKHDVDHGTQITVTLHDLLPWTQPKSLTPATVSGQKALLKRALKHADALVVPTHALANQLSDIADFGQRVRVIPGAAPSTLRLPVNPDQRAKELGLPPDYIVAMGSLEPRRGIIELITAMARSNAPDLPLLIIGPETWGDVTIEGTADEAGVSEGRVAGLGELADADKALVLSRASALVVPSVGEGFGMPLVEAFTFGTPVIHSDDPALVETAGGAGYVVEAEGKGYADRLAEAMSAVLSDGSQRDRLRVLSHDRARAFTWADSASLLWTLHSDL